MYRFQMASGRIVYKSDKDIKAEAEEEYKVLYKEGKIKTPLSRVFVFNEDEEKAYKEEQEKIDKIMNKIFRKFGVQYNLSRPENVQEAWKLYYQIKNKKI